MRTVAALLQEPHQPVEVVDLARAVACAASW
jgi:hypothetical protein